MKVKRKNKFKPIVITIETEDEAEYIWYRLDMADDLFEEFLERNYQNGYKNDAIFGDEIFKEFNEIYKPKIR